MIWTGSRPEHNLVYGQAPGISTPLLGIRERNQTDSGVSAGVDLSPAVCGHVAQDLWHLLEHGQTVDMDLQEKRKTIKHLKDKS